jgi:hypothetical protein
LIVECLARDKICFGWTFDDYKENEGQGTCYLKGSQICCNQNKKKVVKEGAISGFICDNCNKNCTSCWSTFGACPCNQEVERFDPNFGAGGTNLTAFSASVSLFTILYNQYRLLRSLCAHALEFILNNWEFALWNQYIFVAGNWGNRAFPKIILPRQIRKFVSLQKLKAFL